MTRRDFIRRVGLLGGALAGGVLQACAPAAPAQPTAIPKAAEVAKPAQQAPAQPAAAPKPAEAPKPVAAAAAGTPKRGGILRFTEDETPTNWDMHATGLGQTFDIMTPVYNTLIMADTSDPTGEKVVGDLAKDWAISADGLAYTFNLQENVKWHDGAPFSSADVVASMNKIIAPPEGVLSARKELFGSVATVEAPDAKTVVFKMKYPDAAFLEILAVGWNVIYPKHILDKDIKSVGTASVDGKIGTGPFKIVDFKLNQYVKYERNPDYFKSGRPYLDGLEIRFIPDVTARATALVGGNIDMFLSRAGSIGPEDTAIITQQRPDDITIGKIPLLSPIVLYMNTSKPPYDNIKVRQAISDAIDRGALNDALLEGGVVGGLVFPGSRWELPTGELATMPGYGPDMEARKKHALDLLSEAGFSTSKPFSMDLMTRPSPDSDRVATLLGPMFEAVGIKVNLAPETMTRQADLRGTGDFRVTVNNFTQTGVDPTHLFGTYLHCDVPRNQTRFCLPDADQLWAEQRKLIDFDKRKPIVDRMHKMQLEQSTFQVLSWRNGLNAWANYVKGFGMSPALYTAHARLEDVWLDK